MKTVEKNVNDIKPYNKNPRINESAIDQVAQSIKEFGFRQPIVVDKKNVIIIGHTRLLAAKLLGLKKVPVIVADDLTPKKVKALRIADNKTGEFAKWDMNLLKEELNLLDDIFTGFSEAEMDGMFFDSDNDFEGDDSSLTSSKKDDDIFNEVNEVKLSFILSVEDRDKVLSKLNKVKDKHKLGTLAEALVVLSLKN